MRRNSDKALRAAERDAAKGDPQAALRFAIELRRTGRLDPLVSAAAALLDESRSNDLLACWAVATGDGRIRLYRALDAAGIRYPSAAHLAALSADERALCLVSVMLGSADVWYRRLEAFGLGAGEHAVEIVRSSRRDAWGQGDPGNAEQYLGDEGLERARAEGAIVERDWAPLAGVHYPHKDGGFAELTTFLTPTGYAHREVYFDGGARRGVHGWSYDIREGLLPDRADESGVTRDPICGIAQIIDLPFISAVHELELAINRLMNRVGRNFQEHVPGHLVSRAARTWRSMTPRTLAVEEGLCGSHGQPPARCLVVIPSATGIPSVTIGISARSSGITGRTRRITPAHFWPELAPWSDGPPNRNLTRRLADWAATDADDRVRVENGNVALVWYDWSGLVRERLNELLQERRAAQQ